MHAENLKLLFTEGEGLRAKSISFFISTFKRTLNGLKGSGLGFQRSTKKIMTKVAPKYGKLTEDEIKTLVVDDKWLAVLAAAVPGELDRVSQTLTWCNRELAERYVLPLPQFTRDVETLAVRVSEHLKKLGARL